MDNPVRNEQFSHRYLCRVALRRDGEYIVKPRAEHMDGCTAVFVQGWEITEDDHSLYAGEVAMEALPGQHVSGWVASGDLELLHQWREYPKHEAVSIPEDKRPVYPFGRQEVWEGELG